MGNLFRKTISVFRRKLAGKKWQKISKHVAQLNDAPSVNAKTLAFPSFLYRQDSKIYPLKIPKIEIFIANNSPKKIRPPKIWIMINREPVVVFIQQSDKSDQWVPRKLHLNR